eukprot:GILJ01007111.1.p1 GENE.GILJ01007111.1~~GILJ01007111.1.p1  ORF type:complete len:307 (+),score=100.40 GILJ01007111.1:43-921(+)
MVSKKDEIVEDDSSPMEEDEEDVEEEEDMNESVDQEQGDSDVDEEDEEDSNAEDEDDEDDDDDELNDDELDAANIGKKDDEEEESGNEESGDEKAPGVSFAIAMHKILGKRLREEEEAAPILAKYKTTEERIRHEKEQMKKAKELAREKKRLKNKDHVLPDILNKDFERQLLKLATKGVVKLFNAVSQHQKSQDSVSSTKVEDKKLKVDKVDQLSKANFLQLLKKNNNESKSSSKLTKAEADSSSSKSPSWSVFKDDYLMGAKMKDWDKEEEEEEETGEIEVGDEGSSDGEN